MRAAYLLLLSSALHTNTLASALVLEPCLSKVVDTASKQFGQVAMVSEGVHAASCLARMAAVDAATEKQLENFLALVTDPQKQLFWGEKFLGSAGPAALQSVASLAVCLLLSHGERVGEEVEPLLQALATCLLSSSSGVRRHAMKEAGKLGAGLGGASTLCALLSQVTEQLYTREVVLETVPRTEAPPGREEGASGDTPASAATAVLAGLVGASRCSPGAGGEAGSLALALLFTSSHPALHQADRTLWPRLVRRLGVTAQEVLAHHQAAFLEQLDVVLVQRPVQAREVVRAVVQDAPEAVLPHLLERLQVLKDGDLLAASVREYSIYLTPEGQLYDR